MSTAPMSHELKMNALGSTGLRVSAVGFGTVKLGRNQGVKYPQAFQLPDDKEARALIHLARDLGINLIDTAPAYGNSEERLGKLLKGQRQHWVICTKTGEEFVSGESSFDFSADHTRLSVERSLRRLDTDYLDLVLVHSDGNDVHILQHTPVLETLARMKQEGKIRAIGMSSKTLDGGLMAARLADVVMVTCNPDETREVPVLEYCAAHRKGTLIKKALGSGHLALAGKTGEDPVQASMDFIFRQPGVSSIIIGTLSPEHLRHNVHCAAHSAAHASKTPSPAP